MIGSFLCRDRVSAACGTWQDGCVLSPLDCRQIGFAKLHASRLASTTAAMERIFRTGIRIVCIGEFEEM